MTSVAVVGAEGGLGARVARGLAYRGFTATLVDRAGLAAVAGPLAAVVHAEVDPAALRPRPLVEIDEGEWAALADVPVRATLATLRAARARLGEDGRIVVVVPSVGLTGHPGLVPLCAAGEAQRLLAKSAARAWGEIGLTVNVVGADLAALGAAPAESAAATTRGPALPEDDGADDLVDAIALLLHPHAARLTGATLVADAGDLMAP